MSWKLSVWDVPGHSYFFDVTDAFERKKGEPVNNDLACFDVLHKSHDKKIVCERASGNKAASSWKCCPSESISMEPASATAWAKVVSTLKDWPLWLLIAVAISTSVLYGASPFWQLVPPPESGWIFYAMIVAWAFVLCRATASGFYVWHQEYSKTQAKFIVTPIESQCLWSVSRQSDGSYVTHISGSFMVKNLTQEPLHLMKARLLRPRIRGEALRELITMHAMHPGIVVNYIRPSAMLPIATNIIILGVPRRRDGVMNAVVEITDTNANKERVRVKLRCIHPPNPVSIENAGPR